MDMKEMQGPTSSKAPEFFIEDKRGKKTFIPYVLGIPKAEAITRLKGQANVESRTALFTAAIIATVRENPNEFKAEPKKDNAAGKALSELEKSLFGEASGTRGGPSLDPTYKVVKSQYLAYYREHGADETYTERDGNLWIKPLRAVQVARADEREQADPLETFTNRVTTFTESTLTRENAMQYAETAELCMAKLGHFATTAKAMARGEIEVQETEERTILGGYKRQK